MIHQPPQITQFEPLAARFRRNAANDFHRFSPFYEQLALAVADDAAMLTLAAHIPANQPAALHFFGAVHYLLLTDIDAPLAAYFPDLSSHPLPADAAYPIFRDFCLEHRDALIHLLQTRTVQTNEVGRSALLLPIYTLIAERTAYQPLTVVDVGCSGGLNLLWDKYAYDYGDGKVYGEPASTVRLTCELRGDLRPPLPAKLPAVSRRFGIDLRPINVLDPDAALWLRAFVWPENRDRAANLSHAIEVARAYPPPLIAGDVLDLLPRVISTAPPDTALCIYHTYSLYQLPRPARDQLSRIIEAAALERDIYWFGAEGDTLSLTCYESGRVSELTLAHNHPHGRWLEWLI